MIAMFKEREMEAVAYRHVTSHRFIVTEDYESIVFEEMRIKFLDALSRHFDCVSIMDSFYENLEKYEKKDKIQQMENN